MAKKNNNTKKQETENAGITITKSDEEQVEKYTLVELVQHCPVDMSWVIYNLSRTGLLAQYEQELAQLGNEHIEPTITLNKFDKIINGKE